MLPSSLYVLLRPRTGDGCLGGESEKDEPRLSRSTLMSIVASGSSSEKRRKFSTSARAGTTPRTAVVHSPRVYFSSPARRVSISLRFSEKRFLPGRRGSVLTHAPLLSRGLFRRRFLSRSTNAE